ncbi:hypothetical protein AGLY_000045 [Aphis glycines]|uniref:Uncharacterized protein n=1 Tax=Aphis glycines TaxID=307491 RepID=A0A6G0U604_APHGL|nr:hypothetical protein AGLY_000045 [Aphis glycines]
MSKYILRKKKLKQTTSDNEYISLSCSRICTHIFLEVNFYHYRILFAYSIVDWILDGGLDVLFAVLNIRAFHMDHNIVYALLSLVASSRRHDDRLPTYIKIYNENLYFVEGINPDWISLKDDRSGSELWLKCTLLHCTGVRRTAMMALTTENNINNNSNNTIARNYSGLVSTEKKTRVHTTSGQRLKIDHVIVPLNTDDIYSSESNCFLDSSKWIIHKNKKILSIVKCVHRQVYLYVISMRVDNADNELLAIILSSQDNIANLYIDNINRKYNLLPRPKFQDFSALMDCVQG